MFRDSHLWAKVYESTANAPRFTSKARASAMLNQSMANDDPVVSRNFSNKVPFSPNRIFCFCKPEATRNSTHMRIYNNSLCQSEGTAKDYVCCFSANPCQGGQLFDRLGNNSIKLINEFAATTLNVFCFGTKKAGCLHSIFKLLEARL